MEYKPEELLPVWQRLTARYTSNDSSSVSYETARQLMGAMLYCIREWESFGPDGQCGETVGQPGKTPGGEAFFVRAQSDAEITAKEAYDNGCRLIKERVLLAKRLYENMMESFCGYGSRVCRDTMIHGIPAFFVRYDMLFSPQDHLLSLDYPVLSNLEQLSGIDRILEYIKAAALEQRFLSALPEEFVYPVLERSHPEYRELIENLCVPVLRHMLGCMMAKRSMSGEAFTEEDYRNINSFITKENCGSLEDRLKQLTAVIAGRAGGENTGLTAYLQLMCGDFAAGLQNAAENSCLSAFLK